MELYIITVSNIRMANHMNDNLNMYNVENKPRTKLCVDLIHP